jgi:signal transduction histidine kinase/FixJ family two-component response regulator/PAS domain-containing protein
MELTRQMLAHFAALAPSDTAVYQVHGDGALETLYLSSNIPALLDMSREEYLDITNRDAMDLTLPADRPGLKAATAACLRAGAPFDYYYRVFHKVKGFEWVHVRAHICGTLDGRPLLLALFANMTAEGGIYQEILDASDRKALVVDRNTYEILYANEKARNAGDGPAENLLKQSCHLLLCGRDAACEACFLQAPQEGEYGEEVRCNARTGRWEKLTKRRLTWCGHDAILVYSKDITAEKTAMLNLERYRQMYADATQEARLIVWTYEAEEHRVVMLWDGYTREICQKLGVPQVVENVPDSLAAYVDPRDREAFINLYREMEQGAQRSACEFRFQLPGQERPQYERTVATAIFDESGRKLGVYCFGQNITAQKQEEEKYLRAYEELEKSHPYALGSFRLNLTRNWCEQEKSPERAVLQQWRSGPADDFFRQLASLIEDASIRETFSRKFSCAALLESFARGTERVSLEYPTSRDGVRRWREGLLFMMRNPRTGEVEAITYAMDIDARKRMELALEKLIHENFDYIGLIHPGRDTFEFISRRPWVRFGAVGEELDYEACRDYVRSRFTDGEELRRFGAVTALDHILQGLSRDGKCSESYFRTAEGKTLCSRLSYSWLEKPEGDILVIRSDITDSYEQEQQRLARMREALAAADQANEAKSVFLSTMSHDLRTPLNGVLGFTGLALQADSPEKKQEYLQKIQYSGRLLLNLINDTLELSRIESGKVSLTPEVVSSREVGQTVLDSLRPTAEAKGVKLLWKTPPDQYLRIDKLKYQKIWINLLSNAIKYTPAGGTVRAAVEILDPPVGGRNRRIVVEDTGIGMSEAFLSRMFEPFSQENRPEAGNAGGTGLGLAIVKRIVDLLGGTISVSSAPGRGTRFAVDVPIEVVDGPQGGQTAPSALSGSFAGQRVLLCEDNLLNREIAATLLKSRGMEVDCAENGEAGVRLFSASAPGTYDAILMDIRMPVMDGCQAARAIRALGRPDSGVPIIAMTADAFEESIQAARAAGMDRYLTKPVVPEALFGELSQVLHPPCAAQAAAPQGRSDKKGETAL